MDVFDLEAASDPQTSPDGTRIVYVRHFADVMKDRRCSNLWIVDEDGTLHRLLTSGPRHDGSPRWSPRGDRIAWVSASDGSPQIHVRYMDTGESAASVGCPRARRASRGRRTGDPSPSSCT